jgi:uncharacterized membrane protein YebE (DUF533 family)
MENDIALVAAGYVLARIGVIAAFGYLIYRVLQPSQDKKVRVRSRSNYASERYESARNGR